jgi:hypothetical protein
LVYLAARCPDPGALTSTGSIDEEIAQAVV